MRGGVTEVTLSPQSGSTAASGYGSLTITALKDDHIAELVWAGNSTTPAAGAYTYVLPSEYKPKHNSQVAIRRGDGLEIRTDGTVIVRLSATNYSAATLTYILDN